MKCKYGNGNKVTLLPSYLDGMDATSRKKYNGIGTVESSRIQGCWNSLEEINPNFKWEEATNLKNELVAVSFNWIEPKVTKTGKIRNTKQTRTIGVPAIYLQEVAKC